MRIRFLCLPLLVAGLLSSCDSGPNMVNDRLKPGLVETIKKGITTKKEVREILGDPQSVKTQIAVAQPPGVDPLPAKYTSSEIWGYWTTRERRSLFSLPFFKSAPSKKIFYTLIIYLNDSGVVLDYEAEGNLTEKGNQQD